MKDNVDEHNDLIRNQTRTRNSLKNRVCDSSSVVEENFSVTFTLRLSVRTNVLMGTRLYT